MAWYTLAFSSRVKSQCGNWEAHEIGKVPTSEKTEGGQGSLVCDATDFLPRFLVGLLVVAKLALGRGE